MQKFVELHTNLGKCYGNIPYYVYFHNPPETQEKICKKEREEFIEYANSDNMNFDNLLRERIKSYESNNK